MLEIDFKLNKESKVGIFVCVYICIFVCVYMCVCVYFNIMLIVRVFPKKKSLSLE